MGKEPKHTMLPWEIVGDRQGAIRVLQVGSRAVVAQCPKTFDAGCTVAGMSREERLANARLIRDACNGHAELVEACKNLLTALDNCPGEFNYSSAIEDTARAAIAKVQGD